MLYSPSNLCFIYIQITITTVVMQNQTKFFLYFTKVNTKCFFCHTNAIIFLHLMLKSHFLDYWCEMTKYYENKNYNISSKLIAITPHIFSTKCYSSTIIIKLPLSEFLVNLTVPNQQLFSVKLLVGLRDQSFNS